MGQVGDWLRKKYGEMFGETARARRLELSMQSAEEQARFQEELARMMPRILGTLYGPEDVKFVLRGDNADAYIASLLRHLIANVHDATLRAALQEQYFGRPGPWLHEGF